MITQNLICPSDTVGSAKSRSEARIYIITLINFRPRFDLFSSLPRIYSSLRLRSHSTIPGASGLENKLE